MKKRIISVLLAMALILCCAPVPHVHAAETAEGSPAIVVESKYAAANTQVEVNVNITDNPGIAGAKITATFSDKLTLTGATVGSNFAALDYTEPASFVSGCAFNWDSLDAVVSEDGTLLTLTFLVSEDAKANEVLDVTISYRSGDIYNGDLNDVEFEIVNGRITVIDYIPGDVTNDGVVNGKDVTLLRRYNAGYQVSINEAAADVNDDDVINGKDATLIRRFNAGFDVELKPHTPRCSHTMEEIPFKVATCTEDGNVTYYHCTSCGKNFNNSSGGAEIDPVIPATGHTAVTDPYVEPTYNSVGWTEGSHCGFCGEILVAQIEIPILELNSYSISYSFTDSDPYLQGLVDAGTLVNENPSTYTEQDSITLKNLSVAGYTFEGWFDGPWSDAARVTSISNKTGNISLYAKWTKITYTITFDSPDVPVDGITYTVDTGATLVNPTHFGYTFVGWSKDGKILSSIPVGTIGNVTLHANWTSDRNKAVAVSTYGKPVIIEDMDNGQYLFVYEIGTIQNVPLSIIDNLGNTDVLELSDTYEYSQSVDSTFTSKIAQTLSNATTTTSSWTLSEDWNDTSSASSEHEEEIGKTKETVDSQGNVVEGKYYISNVQGGSTSTTKSAGGSSETSSKVTEGSSTGINGSYTKESGNSTSVGIEASVSSSASAEIGASAGPASAKAGYSVEASIGASTNVSETNKQAATIGSQRNVNFGTDKTSSSESHWDTSGTTSSEWNTTESYEAAASTSKNTAVSNAISEVLYDKYGYSSTIQRGGGNSTTQSSDNSSSETKEYSSTVEYSVGEVKAYSNTMTRTYNTRGWYRLVSAGTVHVFAVVGYDIATNSYFTYTYNILDSERHIFLDYSKNDSTFGDCENAILPFEVPYSVHEFVSGAMAKSSDLEIDEETGIITGYTGNADYILIPEYVSASDGVSDPYAVKVSGVSASAFAGNTSIKGIYLPKYVANIPEGAFAGCTSLEVVIGYGISQVGANAFAGCSKLKDFKVDKFISVLGDNAFQDVPTISVVAANEGVADAAINSGADSITLDISGLSAYDNRVITISDSTEYFAVIGNSSNGVTYKNLRIESDAAETFISNMTFVDDKNTPLKFGSEKVTLSRVTVENAPGFAVIMTADDVALDLYGTVSLSSASDNTVISKNVILAKSNVNVAGVLNLTGNYLVCGDITNASMLTFISGEIKYLTTEEYESMLTSSVLTFDPNGGEVDVTEKLVYYGQPYGDLPNPTRTGYGFTGWYTAATGGTLVTADAVVTVLANQTLYAHWDALAYTASWNNGTGYTISVSRTSSPYAGASTGALSSGATVYYGDVLSVTYTASTGYTISSKGNTSITVSSNVTSSDIYATATVNSYKVSWSAGTGYTVAVSRTSSPLAGASTGTLSNGTKIYYGDTLSVTYTASTGYTISSKGSTSITVTGNVTSSDIYATAIVNSYTVSWSTGTGYSIAVNRTSSPYQGASTGSLNSGATVYYGDVLSVTYAASTGYTLGSTGSTSITVSGNVTSSEIYATATANSYTYNIVYVSSNGTSLGTDEVTYNYGTTNTISPKDFSGIGYATPDLQSVVWDSTSAKTITFTYSPNAVGSTSKSGTIYTESYSKLTYAATIEYQNRTANSVQLRVTWTATLSGLSGAAAYNSYGQWFRASSGSVSTGNVNVAPQGTWSSSSSSARSKTASSSWITIPLTTTNATAVNLSIYYYQANYNGTDMSSSGASNLSATWSIPVPAY